jgi:transcriptional regulator with XRE-family HTH domain
MAENGVDNFGEMLSAVMDQHKLNQTELAARLDVSHGTIHRWINGKLPSKSMRDRVLVRLQSPLADQASLPLIPPPGIEVRITGPGITLTMEVTKQTAQRMLQLLIGPNE